MADCVVVNQSRTVAEGTSWYSHLCGMSLFEPSYNGDTPIATIWPVRPRSNQCTNKSYLELWYTVNETIVMIWSHMALVFANGWWVRPATLFVRDKTMRTYLRVERHCDNLSSSLIVFQLHTLPDTVTRKKGQTAFGVPSNRRSQGVDTNVHVFPTWHFEPPRLVVRYTDRSIALTASVVRSDNKRASLWLSTPRVTIMFDGHAEDINNYLLW